MSSDIPTFLTSFPPTAAVLCGADATSMGVTGLGDTDTQADVR